MIYTITINPALDRTLSLEKIAPDDANRIQKDYRYAGGKGIDVSRVLTTLGIENKALGFVGGFAGEELEGRLLNEGITGDFIRISGETRTNIIVNETQNGCQTVFSASGPEISSHELMQLIHKLEQLPQPEMVVVSGSLPPGVHPAIYRKIIEMAKNKGARAVLDTDGEALRIGMQAIPDIIKPNVHELGRLVGKQLGELAAIIDAAHSVRNQGVGIVLVSMGARGMLLVTGKEQYLACPPEVEVKNTIGAGDSAVAGFVYGLIRSNKLKEALVFAVAAGTATTLRVGTALCRKEDFLKLVPEIKLEEK